MKDKLVNKNINQINIQRKKNYNDIKINDFSKKSNCNTNRDLKDEDDTEENNTLKTEYNNIYKQNITIEKDNNSENKNVTPVDKVLIEKGNNSPSFKPIKSMASPKNIKKINTPINKIKPSDKKIKVENTNVNKKSNEKKGNNKNVSKLNETSLKSKYNTIKMDKKIININDKSLKDKIKISPLSKTQIQSLSRIASKASLIEIKNPREHINSASSFYSTTTTASTSSSLSSYSKTLNKTQLEIHQRFKKMKQEKLNNLQNNNNNTKNNAQNDNGANNDIEKYNTKNDKKKKSNVVNLSISTLTGQQFALKVLSSYTISDLKDLIQEKEGIPSQTQILIFQDKTLDCDSMTLEDYGIENGASMKLIIKLYDGNFKNNKFIINYHM